MRGLFSGNRASAPLGPPPGANSAAAGNIHAETIQGVRQRQKEKRRQFAMQVSRLEKEKEVAEREGDAQKSRELEVRRKAISETVEQLGEQLIILERVMRENGLSAELDEEDEEELRRGEELLEESREEYEEERLVAEERIRDSVATGEYMSTMASAFMMPSDVLDEDEAMRDLDECAKQTGRT